MRGSQDNGPVSDSLRAWLQSTVASSVEKAVSKLTATRKLAKQGTSRELVQEAVHRLASLAGYCHLWQTVLREVFGVLTEDQDARALLHQHHQGS